MDFRYGGVLRGTRILTPLGEETVETLCVGDRVVTRFGGIQAIRWIGRYTGDRRALADDRENFPVAIRAGALAKNQPARDLYVSPAQLLLVDDTLVSARALVNGITITQESCQLRLDYFSLDLGAHDCLIAEGTWTESFADIQDGTEYGSRGAYQTLDAFYDHHANRAPADEPALCAPRPERGAPLETVLGRVAARAAEGVVPGPMEGFIEAILQEFYVEGWALDLAHPELPVPLHVFLGEEQIGTTLACAERADLKLAGKGRGRCSFRFISPIRLRPERQPTVRIVRATDGAELPMIRSCADAIAALLAPPPGAALRLVS